LVARGATLNRNVPLGSPPVAAQAAKLSKPCGDSFFSKSHFFWNLANNTTQFRSVPYCASEWPAANVFTGLELWSAGQPVAHGRLWKTITILASAVALPRLRAKNAR